MKSLSRNIFLAWFLLAYPLGVSAESVNDLLRMVEQGRIAESHEHRAREARFRQEKNHQQAIFNNTLKARQKAEQHSLELETRYETKEAEIATLKQRLDERMGSLKELFGHLQTTVGGYSTGLHQSITSSQYKGREQVFAELSQKINDKDRLPSITELETLWYEVQREIIATGQVEHFQATIIGENGQPATQDVVRLGSFNLISNGDYLQYVPETGKLLPYPKQPPDHLRKSSANFQAANSGLHAVGLDPTRGAILNALVDTPSILERVEQGGLIGYFILALGCIALLMSIERSIYLTVIARKVNNQIHSNNISLKNPLGRIFQVYADNKHLNLEALELKLGEAILKERIPMERFIPSIKIVAVVAPLLGLLGTVTGMINTFQAITLFGTGDPKVMAGGISQALVTTVEGLAVAVPIVLMHAVVNSRFKLIIMVLEEQSTGLVAKIAERDRQHVVSD